MPEAAKKELIDFICSTVRPFIPIIPSEVEEYLKLEPKF